MKPFGGIATGLNLGNFGFVVKGVSPQQVFKDPKFFKDIFKRNKVIVFVGMNPTQSEHSQVANCLLTGEHDSSCTDGLLENQNHPTIYDVEGTDLSLEQFVANQWHVDNCFFEHVPDVISMHMKVFNVDDPTKGHTYLASLLNLYRSCPSHLKEKLKTARFSGETGAAGRSVISHPALRTHPETGETVLYWTGEGTHLEGEQGNDTPWFKELQKYVRSHLAEARNQFVWKWGVGDVIVWDNRSSIHGFGNGWQRADRIFDRIEIGYSTPYFDEDLITEQQAGWGALGHKEGQGTNEIGVNPDHIPLVFTKGISALKGLEYLFQKVSIFAFVENAKVVPSNLQTVLQKFDGHWMKDDIGVVLVDLNQDSLVLKHLQRYSESFMSDHPKDGQLFLFGRNGDLHGAYTPDIDLISFDGLAPGEQPFASKLEALLVWHPDFRHAGHAWHYPDWFKHQPLKFRPWSYHHLKFMEYHDLKGALPDEDFLVQFAIDSIYGCFNHFDNNEDRFKMIWRIKDYLDYMLDLGEHENER